MDTPTTRISRPSRIVALLLIALAVLGLAYLRYGQSDRTVSVPSGAKAGDLTLESCQYATDSGSYDADCGTLVVAENPSDPDSPLIALPVVRIRARSATPREPIFRLEGGPGLTNMDFDRASRYVDNRDLVLVGYRGVDGSVQLDCPEVSSVHKRSTDVLSEEFFNAKADAYRACARRFADEGVDPSRYGLVQQIDDLEAARVALGYDRINLLSESAGTRTALVYGWRHPERIHRSVMTGVNPPGNFLWDPDTTDEQMGRYAALCAEDAGCRARTDDLAATVRRVAADVPERWLFWPIKPANVQAIAIYGLTEPTPRVFPPGAPAVLDAWLSAAEGDASGLWLSSLLGDVFTPNLFVLGQHAAFGNIDADAAPAYFAAAGPEGYANFGLAATASGWAGGQLADAWPIAPETRQYRQPRTSQVETLLIGGTLDFATPPQKATNELLPYLPNGHEVVLEGIGHNSSFWTDQPEASSRLINTFFDNGQVDDSLYKPQSVDFTPEVTLTAFAKRVAGTMVGLALLAVLSLLWMARHVRKRGGFGRKASASLRSLYPLVLGLGGWFLGVLIVLTTMPGVPLDNALLAVLGVGVPIGLGIYWAWVQRAWSGQTKIAGFAAAAAGALVGAWLGFNATADLLALVTAIVGAAAGANVTLILVDIARDRSLRARRAATAASDATPVGSQKVAISR
jgi:pimeloyl-ACP methyl ester carboxylesterase